MKRLELQIPERLQQKLNQELRRKRTEYETALFVSDTYAPRGGESTLGGIEMIAEAMKEVPESLRLYYPEIDWRGIIGMRNITTHQYW